MNGEETQTAQPGERWWLSADALQQFHADRLAYQRIRFALSAETRPEIVDRLVGICDLYDPAEDWLVKAARVIAGGS